jgi:hypothetical protein
VGDKLLSASACDKAYHLRNGTASSAARANLVKYCERPGRGRYRRIIYIDARDAERRWGAKQHREVSCV